MLLGAANAAGSADQPLASVLPWEGTWVMKLVGSTGHKNVLTIAHLGPPGSNHRHRVDLLSIIPIDDGRHILQRQLRYQRGEWRKSRGDIQEVGGDPEDPGAPQTIFWLSNSRLTHQTLLLRSMETTSARTTDVFSEV